mmetsp:Transcript_32815/g.83865  ORF Transcript_32815/g.83865 Transcript_32815/m.83865 type:complete len:289 (+) Transcript_32815:1540-2406(+)
MCTRALWVSSAADLANDSASLSSPAFPPFAMPVSTASRQNCGCCRWGDFFFDCPREYWMICLASNEDSRRSVRVSELWRGFFPPAMASAICLATMRTVSSVHTASTSPSFFAWAPFTGLEVSIISTAFFRPTRRGRRWVPPKPGMMPSCSSGSPRLVLGPQMRALQAMATSRPPPSATPRMAATVGFGPASMRSHSIWLTSLSRPPPPEANWLISKPAQKLSPAPVMTMPFTAGLSCADFAHAARSLSTFGWSALTGGLHIRMMATPSGSTSIVVSGGAIASRKGRRC